MLSGWILGTRGALTWFSGGHETVEVKGGTSAPPTTARAKQAEKAEEEIFKRTKKLKVKPAPGDGRTIGFAFADINLTFK